MISLAGKEKRGLKQGKQNDNTDPDQKEPKSKSS